MEINRNTEFVILPVAAVRGIHTRTDDDVIQAQRKITPEMIRALEELVNAAKSNALQDDKAVLAMAAGVW
ncbi:plasmid maintenance system antidote protein VapI [Bradyrhizobium diazoefficiens]